MVSTRYAPAPGFFGIFFGVSLSLLAGALLAAAHLIAKPVEVLTVEPKEREPGQIYFVRGVKGGDWERKVATLNNTNATVRFSEGELNSWAESIFEAQLIRSKSDGTQAKEMEMKAIARGLNLRFVDSELQAGLVLERAVGQQGSLLVLQMRGGFSKGPFGWAYRPVTGYFGSLPLHKVPGAITLMRTYFQGWAPELAKAESIELGDGVLAVRMP